jgi:hypothetical protein
VSQTGSIAIYPLALGLLVLSRAFGVARSAVIPRVTPPELTLVKVNSRMSFVNIVAGLVVAPLGLAIAHIPGVGYPWMLRACALVYLAGTLLSFNLPANVDSAAGERRVQDLARAEGEGDGEGVAAGRGGRLRRALGALPVALRGTCALRGLVGFLTIYMAFLLKSSGGTNAWLAALGASAGIGSGLGVVIGGRLGRRKPEALLLIAMVMAGGGCVGAAVTYTRVTSLLATLLAMMAGSMGKLALDAVVQRDIPEDTRSSAFARSETALQLAWVLGGALGLVEMAGVLGFSLASGAMAVAVVTEVGALRQLRKRRRGSRFRAGAATAVPAPAGPANDGHTAPQGAIPTTGA